MIVDEFGKIADPEGVMFRTENQVGEDAEKACLDSFDIEVLQLAFAGIEHLVDLVGIPILFQRLVRDIAIFLAKAIDAP